MVQTTIVIGPEAIPAAFIPVPSLPPMLFLSWSPASIYTPPGFFFLSSCRSLVRERNLTWPFEHQCWISFTSSEAVSSAKHWSCGALVKFCVALCFLHGDRQQRLSVPLPACFVVSGTTRERNLFQYTVKPVEVKP